MKDYKDGKIGLLHLVQSLGMGGAEMLLLYYIRALGKEKYRHYVYCFTSGGPKIKKIEKLGVPVHMGPRLSSIKNPFKFTVSTVYLVKDLMRFIRDHSIDIIQSHLGQANQLGVFVGKLAGVPTFPTVHNTMAFVDRRSRLDFRVHLLRVIDAVIYRISDRVVAVSEEIKEIIQKRFGLSESRVVLVKNGIILEESSAEQIKLEEEFPIKAGAIKLIGVGTLTYQKAFEVFVMAVSELVKRGTNNLFAMIVGTGEERSYLEDLIHGLGIGDYVKLVGIRSDVLSMLKASDIFIMPSRYEGLSIAMIEAMGCGVPIIASDAPGLNAYIEHGQNGLLFPVEDHKALAGRIQQLIDNPNLRVRLSQGARESFERHYDMRNNVKALDDLFRIYTAGM